MTTWRTQLSTFKWTYTATNRLLFEVGVAPGASPDTITAEPVAVRYPSGQGSPVGSTLGIRPLTYRAPQSIRFRRQAAIAELHGAMSYVTGSHSVKIGMDMQRGHFERR